jgi:site-specific DNA recombinase
MCNIHPLTKSAQLLDARIMRLRERLKAGDPDLAPDEQQAGIERAENNRSELLDVRPAERQNARVLALIPRAAQLYREQIDLGLGGDPAAAVGVTRYVLFLRSRSESG